MRITSRLQSKVAKTRRLLGQLSDALDHEGRGLEYLTSLCDILSSNSDISKQYQEIIGKLQQKSQ